MLRYWLLIIQVLSVSIKNRTTFWPIMFKQNILFNGFIKKQKHVNILGFDTITFAHCNFISLRNSLSEGTEVAGIVRNCLVWMRYRKGKSYLVSAHYLKEYSFQTKQSYSKYVVTTILKVYCEALYCCVATKLSMNDHNGDGFCSSVEYEATDWVVEVTLWLLAEIEAATSIVSPGLPGSKPMSLQIQSFWT